MTQADFVRHVEALESDNERSILAKSRVVCELLDEVITSGQEWSDQAVVDLLLGRWGPETRQATAMAIEAGLKEGGAMFSFTRFCVRHERLPLLSAVADMGLSGDIKASGGDKHYTQATTESGRWLDVLANVGEAPRTTFARQVGAFSTSAAGSVLADILVRHDPRHGDVDALQGTPAAAVFAAALMRALISSRGIRAPDSGPGDSGPARSSPAPSAPVRRRLRMGSGI